MRCLNKIGFIAALLITFCLVGCEKEPIHDSIEQQWRLERFTILETNETVACSNLFYSITRMVTEVAEKTVSDGHQDVQGANGYGAFIARTEYQDNGKKIVLSDFKVNGYNTDTKVDATAEQLKPFGIDNPNKTVFEVKENAGNRLVLVSDYARLELKKY